MCILSMVRGRPFGETAGHGILFDAPAHKIALVTALLHFDDEIVVGVGPRAHCQTGTSQE